MTFDEALREAQQAVRDAGFMSAMGIISQVLGHGDIPDGGAFEVLEHVAHAPDIHCVEYINSMVSDYRVKDLFFYNPNLKKE